MTLIEYIDENLIEPTHAMNLLQDAGIVSDLCVTAGNVAVEDHQIAISFLKKTIN